MATTTNRNPARHMPENSSLTGVLDRYARPAIVWALLTLAIAVVGWRIFREAGAPRMNAIAAEAVAIYESSSAAGSAQAVQGMEESERRLLEISGVPVDLPPEAEGLVVTGLERVTLRKRPAAGLRFRYDGGNHLLIVFRQDRILGGKARPALPEESLLSGERDGRSFVLWERDGASFIMVSDVDVIRALNLVRMHFT